MARPKRMIPMLEKIAAVPEADARAEYVVGLAHFKAGDDKAAQEWFRKSLDHCRRQRGDRVLHFATTQLVIGAARLAEARGWREVLKKAADDYLYVNEGFVDGAELAGVEKASPPLLWAKELVADPEAFLDWFRQVGPAIFERAALLLESVRAKHPADAMQKRLMAHVGKSPSMEAYRDLAILLGWVYNQEEMSAQVLKGARAKVSDPRLEFAAARIFLRVRKTEDALEAAALGVKLAEAGKDAALEESLGLFKARMQLLQGDLEGARATVRRLMERGRAARDAHVAEVCEFAGMLDEAKKRYDGLLARRQRPYLQLARIHESLAGSAADAEAGRRHAVESVRFYNGHARKGSSVEAWPEDEEMLLPLGVAGASSDPGTGREKMLALVGAETFIAELLKRRFDAPAAEVEKEIRAAYRRLCDASADPGARVEAIDRLKAAGLPAVPFIKDGLGSKDVWVRDQVRGLLSEWGEPAP